MSNAYRAFRTIARRRSRQVMVGSVPVGGDAPISVQTMTNSLTSDIPGTLAQINAAAEAGADIVRVSCPDQESTTALRTICQQSPVPIVADIHFHTVALLRLLTRCRLFTDKSVIRNAHGCGSCSGCA